MTVNRQDIRNYPLPRGRIVFRYSLEYEEQEARISYGLSPDEYDKLPGCSWWCDKDHPISKSEVIAMWRLRRLMAAVEEHARQPKKGQR